MFCLGRTVVAWIIVVSLAAGSYAGENVRGHYLEARTCQVYTGPCFANGEMGLTGKDAVMAWNILEGSQQGVDLAGLTVVVVVKASDTLGHEGINDAQTIRSVIYVDAAADDDQRAALVAFAKKWSGKAGSHVEQVRALPITMELDTLELTGSLHAGNAVELVTRKARPGDCICSNEECFYPPLAQVEYSAPGVTITGDVKAGALGGRWSIPDTRSAYLATFVYE
jgi:hypothetical protein